jgi:hypothetical protein
MNSRLAIRPLPAANFTAETQAHVANGPDDNGYGMVVGNSAMLIAFLVSGDGYTSVLRRIDREWQEAQPWPHVRRDEAVNALRLECRDSLCAFYVNEEMTTRFEAGAQRDRIGFAVWRSTEEKLAVAFEYLRVWQ